MLKYECQKQVLQSCIITIISVYFTHSLQVLTNTNQKKSSRQFACVAEFQNEAMVESGWATLDNPNLPASKESDSCVATTATVGTTECAPNRITNCQTTSELKDFSSGISQIHLTDDNTCPSYPLGLNKDGPVDLPNNSRVVAAEIMDMVLLKSESIRDSKKCKSVKSTIEHSPTRPSTADSRNYFNAQSPVDGVSSPTTELSVLSRSTSKASPNGDGNLAVFLEARLESSTEAEVYVDSETPTSDIMYRRKCGDEIFSCPEASSAIETPNANKPEDHSDIGAMVNGVNGPAQTVDDERYDTCSIDSDSGRQYLYDQYYGHYSPAGRGYPHGFHVCVIDPPKKVVHKLEPQDAVTANNGSNLTNGSFLVIDESSERDLAIGNPPVPDSDDLVNRIKLSLISQEPLVQCGGNDVQVLIVSDISSSA